MSESAHPDLPCVFPLGADKCSLCGRNRYAVTSPEWLRKGTLVYTLYEGENLWSARVEPGAPRGVRVGGSSLESVAALMRAAPELLAALRTAARLVESGRVLAVYGGHAASERAFDEGLVTIRAAIDKAKEEVS